MTFFHKQWIISVKIITYLTREEKTLLSDTQTKHELLANLAEIWNLQCNNFVLCALVAQSKLQKSPALTNQSQLFYGFDLVCCCCCYWVCVASIIFSSLIFLSSFINSSQYWQFRCHANALLCYTYQYNQLNSHWMCTVLACLCI